MSRPFISLRFSASKLAKMDEYSLSDPFLVLYVKEKPGEDFKQVGKTGVIINESDPEWYEHFEFELKDDVNYTFKASVYDSDLPETMMTVIDRYNPINKADERYLYPRGMVGESVFTLEQLRLMSFGRMELDLHKVIRRKVISRGRLMICSEVVQADSRSVFVHLKVKNGAIHYKEHFEYNLFIYRIRRDAHRMLVYRQPLIYRPDRRNELDVEFNGTNLKAVYANGDWNAKLEMWFQFRVNKSSKIVYLMGIYSFCLNDIVRMRNVFTSASAFRVPERNYPTLSRKVRTASQKFNLYLLWFQIK